MDSSPESSESMKIEKDEITVAGDEKDVSFRDLVIRMHQSFCVISNHRLSDLI